MTKKIYNIALQAWRGRRCCGLMDGEGSTAPWALRRRCLREEDNTTGLGTMRVDGIAGSGTVPGTQHRGLREDDIVTGLGMVSRAWGRCLRSQQHHWLGRGKWRRVKGLDYG
jgi:hypothetical protein